MKIAKTNVYVIKERFKKVYNLVFSHKEGDLYYFHFVKKFMGVWYKIDGLYYTRMPDKVFDCVVENCYVVSKDGVGDTKLIDELCDFYKIDWNDWSNSWSRSEKMNFEYKYGDRVVMMSHPYENMFGIGYTSSDSHEYDCVYRIEKYWETDEDEDIYHAYKYKLVPEIDPKYNKLKFPEKKMYASDFQLEVKTGIVRKVNDKF